MGTYILPTHRVRQNKICESHSISKSLCFSILTYPLLKNSNSISEPEDEIFILTRWSFSKSWAASSNWSRGKLLPRHPSRTSRFNFPVPFISSAKITRSRYSLISSENSFFHKFSWVSLFKSSRLFIFIADIIR